jgi:hypothetical protein
VNARGLIDYPVPLEGAVAHLMLPRDLTAAEVERLHRILLSLVQPDPAPAPAAGPESKGPIP